MTIEKRLIEIKERAETARTASDKEVLNAKAEELGKSFISIGGELDNIVLLANDALGMLDALKGTVDEKDNG